VLIGGIAAADAQAFIASKTDRIDAKRFARNFWAQRAEQPNCYNVGIRWRPFPFGSRDIAMVPMDWRDGDSKCVIVMNSRVDWSYNVGAAEVDPWWRLCATLTHEWGHLYGMPYSFGRTPHRDGHSHSPNSIMYANEQGQFRYAWWWPHFPGCRYDGDGLG
jgi:hypothetical protein